MKVERCVIRSVRGQTLIVKVHLELPGGPAIKTLLFQCRGQRNWGTKIPHAHGVAKIQTTITKLNK